MQYMLSRRQILERGTLAPRGDAADPRALQRQRDEPVDGQAGAGHRRLRCRVAAHQHGGGGVECRRGLPVSAAALGGTYEPAGLRGDFPANAARYWGLTQQEYYPRADVWPLAPEGEILVVIMCEDVSRHRQSSPDSQRGARHRRRAERRRGSLAEPRLSAPVGSSGRDRRRWPRSCASARSTTSPADGRASMRRMRSRRSTPATGS